MHPTPIYHTVINSPVGNIYLASTATGICAVEFEMPNGKLPLYYFKKNAFVFQEGLNEHLEVAISQLSEYFSKKRKHFDVPIDFIGSPFQIEVWKTLLNIPYGTISTYKAQAIALGDLKAIRAMASANGANKIAIIVPCHRVIGSDGSLTGYAGGIGRKQFLLDLESTQQQLF